MEQNRGVLRLEICEKCYEHQKTCNHDEMQLTFYAVTQLSQKLHIKLLKNHHPKYLAKMPDSKFSSKRFMDSNYGKIVEFPRKGAFEIYFFNILIFSKLQYGTFPNFNLLGDLLEIVREKQRQDPMLKIFSKFKDFLFEIRKTSKTIQPLYSFIKLYISEIYTKQAIIQIINQINHTKTDSKQKTVYPYSFYGRKQKKSELQKIYHPQNIQIVRKARSLQVPKKKLDISRCNVGKICLKGKKRQKKNFLFKLVMMNGGEKISNENLKKKLKMKDFSNLSAYTKQIYYINIANRKVNKKQMSMDNEKVEINRLNINEFQFSQTHQFIADYESDINKLNTVSQFKISQNSIGSQSIIGQTSSKIEIQMEAHDYVEVKEDVGNVVSQLLNQIVQRCAQNIDKQQLQKQKKEQVKIVKQFINEKKRYSTQNRVSRYSSAKNYFTLIEEKFKQTSSKADEEDEETRIINLNINKNMRQWMETKEIEYEEAGVRKKFSDPTNYQSNLFNEEKKRKISIFTKFRIEILETHKVITIRELFRPLELKLFPEILRKVQNTKSKLAYVVNYLISISQLIISRMFENRKSTNSKGIYCVWLMNEGGVYRPVYVNDEFAVDKDNNLIYGQIEGENSIWFMILQKAIAKILGGYDKLAQANISSITNVILGCPQVSLKKITPNKVIKMFDNRNFFSKINSIICYRPYNIMKSEQKIDRVVNFHRNYSDVNNSFVNVLIEGQIMAISLLEFIKTYQEIILIIFDNSYFMNQKPIEKSPKTNLLVCNFSSKFEKNNTYLIFNEFPISIETKVTIYRKLSQKEADIPDGMNPLIEEQRRSSYIGEITKKGDFFFQVQLQSGYYTCLMEGNFQEQCQPHISIFSEHPVMIDECFGIQNFRKHKNSHIQVPKKSRKREGAFIPSSKENPFIRKCDSKKMYKCEEEKSQHSQKMISSIANLKVNITKMSNSSNGKSIRLKKKFLIQDDWIDFDNNQLKF